MGVIYKSTCLITGKSYIGQTKRTLEQRRKQHERSKDDYIFHRALKKYGIQNFRWDVLENCPNQLLNEKEKFWIKQYNTYKEGYNLTKGGDTADALDKWKKENSQKVLENAMKALVYANKYNQTHKEQRLLQLASARKIGIEKVKRKVKCLEMNLIFQSISEAEKWSLSNQNPNGKKASHQHISKVCRGERKTCGGYHWEYI